jgi:hypothetical protein
MPYLCGGTFEPDFSGKCGWLSCGAARLGILLRELLSRDVHDTTIRLGLTKSTLHIASESELLVAFGGDHHDRSDRRHGRVVSPVRVADSRWRTSDPAWAWFGAFSARRLVWLNVNNITAVQISPMILPTV